MQWDFVINASWSLWATSIWHARLWYALPLVVAVSLVYGATRHERMKEILEQAVRTTLWLSVFMGVIFAVIWLIGYWN